MGVRYPTSGAVSAASTFGFFVEVPTGLINGVNTVYTTVNPVKTPYTTSAAVFQNGLLIRPNTDYSVSGLTFTWAVAPLVGDTILICYAALI